MIGTALKGVASLLPKNTLVNKIANDPTSIKAKDIRNAISDVKGSLRGQRGIVGNNTPRINILGTKQDKNLGGISTLAPSLNSLSSAIAQQKSVSQSLIAGSTGVAPSSSPIYASSQIVNAQKSAEQSRVLDKGVQRDDLKPPTDGKKDNTLFYVLGAVAVYFFIK
jgi:hypothetical protein